MYKTSALKCSKCPHFSNKKCKITEKQKTVEDICDVGADKIKINGEDFKRKSN